MFRRKLMAALGAACVLSSPAAGAEVWQARLLLAGGEPASGHVVSVVGSPLSAVCDENGVFSLTSPPAPPFQIVAKGPDSTMYSALTIDTLATAEPAEGIPVELRLEPLAVDSVTVVSGIAPGLDLLPGSAAAVISAEAFEQRPPQRLVDVLDSVAGASKLGEGADSVPALRGLARGRTLILLDGARVSAERRAGPSATFVDPNGLAAVEVLRGPGSVVYGSDAFGGVIQAVTRDPDLERASARVGVEAAAGGEDRTSAFVSGSLPIGTAALLVEVHGAEGRGQEAGGGDAIFNSSFESLGGALRLLAPIGPGRLRASLQVERVDDLGKAAIDSRQIRAVYPLEDADRLVLSWIADPAGAWDSLDATAFYGKYRIVLDRDRAPTSSARRRIDTADTDAGDASFRFVAGRPAGGGRLQLGLDSQSRFALKALVGRTDFAADATTVTARTVSEAIEAGEQTSHGLFATWSRPLAERWTLGVGARGDRVASKNRGGFFGDHSETADALSGNIALSGSLPRGWTATAQVARGFRVPTLSDRYFRGPSGRGFVTGNPELEPETSLQTDLALRRAAGRGAIAFYAYQYQIDDLIERYAQGDNFFFRNRGRARVEGLEAEAQARFASGVSLEAGASLVRSRGADAEALDDAPAPGAWLTGRYTAGRAYAFARAAGFDRKDDPGPTETERPGYVLLDLGGGYHLTDEVELRLAVRNAFDREYTASPDVTSDRSPGRTVTLGVSGKF